MLGALKQKFDTKKQEEEERESEKELMSLQVGSIAELEGLEV